MMKSDYFFPHKKNMKSEYLNLGAKKKTFLS